MKVIKQTTWQRADLGELNDAVNRLIEQGWQPIGGIVVAKGSSVLFHYQTMCLYEETQGEELE